MAGEFPAQGWRADDWYRLTSKAPDAYGSIATEAGALCILRICAATRSFPSVSDASPCQPVFGRLSPRGLTRFCPRSFCWVSCHIAITASPRLPKLCAIVARLPTSTRVRSPNRLPLGASGCSAVGVNTSAALPACPARSSASTNQSQISSRTTGRVGCSLMPSSLAPASRDTIRLHGQLSRDHNGTTRTSAARVRRS